MNRRQIGLLILFGFILFLVVSLSFFIYKTQIAAVLGSKTDPLIQVRVVINEVARHMLLPSDELPTLATVSDITKLKSQSFFSNAQNGDKVLIYTQNRLAILYRPSIDKIIVVVPINVTNNSQQTNENTNTIIPPSFPTLTPIANNLSPIIYKPNPQSRTATISATPIYKP